MHGVRHFLYGAGRGMTPYLLFVLADSHAAMPLAPDNILGAALLHEFQILGLRSGVFVTEGKDGMRSIIAPAESRSFIAAAVSTALLEQQAQLIVASYVESGASVPVTPQPLSRRAFHWATATRPIPGFLPLAKTLDETLQTLNKKTRFNFRYYRRLLEAETPLEFVPDVAAVLSLPDMLALNRRALGPVSDDVMIQRHNTFARQPGAYLCGLRTQAGEWLALIGGWRQEDTTVLQWQLNLSGYEKFSLVTVARSFWMEHEIAIGSKTLRIDGGTTHAMNHSFVPENAVDLMLRRKSLRAFAMVKLAAPLVANRKITLARNNFLAKTLTNPSLNWRQQSPAAAHQLPSEPQYARGPRSV
ncbi:MAG TPA: hypothetical protein VH250_05075 [Granulicella sp.]|jgi:hypothetical protein|nr:hypothetical protein [Granulicella sp.]